MNIYSWKTVSKLTLLIYTFFFLFEGKGADALNKNEIKVYVSTSTEGMSQTAADYQGCHFIHEQYPHLKKSHWSDWFSHKGQNENSSPSCCDTSRLTMTSYHYEKISFFSHGSIENHLFLCVKGTYWGLKSNSWSLFKFLTYIEEEI